MSSLVTVTGATGNVGRHAAESLLESGLKVRAIGRNQTKLAPLAAAGAEAHAGDLGSAAFMTEALRGADSALLVIPGDYSSADVRLGQRRIAAALAEALRAAGTPRAVLISSLGAERSDDTGPVLVLHEMEDMLRLAPGLSAVSLRPTFFMENLLASIPLIRAAGINGSLIKADMPLAMIAAADVGRAAAGILRAPSFEGFSVRELLGPAERTMREATSLIGAGIGKPDLAYVEFSADDLRQGLMQVGLSEDGARMIVTLQAALNGGLAASLEGRNPSNTTPTSLETFVREVFVPVFSTRG